MPARKKAVPKKTRPRRAAYPGLRALNNRAVALREQGDLAGARQLLEKVLLVCRELLGATKPRTVAVWQNLLGVMWAQGDADAARALQQQPLEDRRREHGDDHPDTLAAMEELADRLAAQGDLPGAR
ncbi:MAG TPA: tetratricopeptide repeat protein, partial [Vicinamibacteria bacterium]